MPDTWLRYSASQKLSDITFWVRLARANTALTQLKGFNSKEPYLPQILELERGCEQYELASREAVQASLKAALLLRSLSGVMRQHISASLPEDASYTTLREAILRHERTQFKWGTHNLFGSDAVLLGSPSKTPHDEPWVSAGMTVTSV